MIAVMSDEPVNLEQAGVFNIISHRDASIPAILSVDSASNPVTALNLSGHTVAEMFVKPVN